MEVYAYLCLNKLMTKWVFFLIQNEVSKHEKALGIV